LFIDINLIVSVDFKSNILFSDFSSKDSIQSKDFFKLTIFSFNNLISSINNSFSSNFEIIFSVCFIFKLKISLFVVFSLAFLREVFASSNLIVCISLVLDKFVSETVLPITL
jgi:hypothetical protein